RGRQLEWREIAGGDRTIVGDAEVAVPAAEVADIDADSRRQLMLDTLGELPVVGTCVPALKRGRVIRGAGNDLAEPEVADDATGVPAARTQILRQRVDQVAVRREVVVGIGPAA